jgi:RNA polymerase sigma-70 factor (ECF subfamily)
MTPAALREERPIDAIEPQGPTSAERPPVDEARLRRMLDEYFDFVWRSLRRFGLSDDRAEDGAQQVFMIASRKLDMIQPESERSFLFGTAMRVASDVRRGAAYRREVAHADAGLDVADASCPDALLDQRRAREMLDRFLDAMDDELRTVFVLFEIEEMSTAEIAALVGIPHGTVASRLRRAREDFEARVARVQRAPRGGGA